MPKIPRNVSGKKFASLLRKFGYSIVRKKGSHIRMVSTNRGFEHKVTIPDHKSIKIGTLNNILNDLADYLEIPKEKLVQELFENHGF